MPEVLTVIRETWLSRPVSPHAKSVTILTTAVLVAASCLYWSSATGASEWMPAWNSAVFQKGELYRLWTTLFAHADPGHLLSNSLLFFILGYFLSGYFGALVFPFAAFFWGGLTNVLVLWTSAPEMRLIGASGVVFWMGGAWLTLYFLLNTKKSVFQRGIRAAGVALGLFMPAQAFDPQISYKAHFIGFVLGVVWAGLYYLWRRQTFKRAEVIEVEEVWD